MIDKIKNSEILKTHINYLKIRKKQRIKKQQIFEKLNLFFKTSSILIKLFVAMKIFLINQQLYFLINF